MLSTDIFDEIDKHPTIFNRLLETTVREIDKHPASSRPKFKNLSLAGCLYESNHLFIAAINIIFVCRSFGLLLFVVVL